MVCVVLYKLSAALTCWCVHVHVPYAYMCTGSELYTQVVLIVERSSPCSGVHIWTVEKAAEIEQFFKDNPCPVADRIVKQNCEAIRLNFQWLERDSAAIEEWFKTQ